MKAILRLTELQIEGDGFLDRLARARTREDVARYVRALRRWHGQLRPAALAYSEPLAESLRKMNPHPEEYARVLGVRLIGVDAHRLLLITTATALYRIVKHLANAKPVKKTGPKPRSAPEALTEFRRQMALPEPPSMLDAAKTAVAEFGKGDHASPRAAVDAIRKIPLD